MASSLKDSNTTQKETRERWGNELGAFRLTDPLVKKQGFLEAGGIIISVD